MRKGKQYFFASLVWSYWRGFWLISITQRSIYVDKERGTSTPARPSISRAFMILVILSICLFNLPICGAPLVFHWAGGWEKDLLENRNVDTDSRPLITSVLPTLSWTENKKQIKIILWKIICTAKCGAEPEPAQQTGLSGPGPKMGFKWMFTNPLFVWVQTGTSRLYVMEVPNQALTCKFALTWKKFV